MGSCEFERSVFINCPFDEEYEHILQAILFCLVRFGLTPRLAKERRDAGEPRIQKILELVQSSKYSIHDLSRSQAREEGEHYRLNMPFELGIDIGSRYFGQVPLSEKAILVLVEHPHRYQPAISDLAGSDFDAHHGDYQKAVRKVRNWLMELSGFETVGANRILSEYEDFQAWYLKEQREAGFSDEDIQDYSTAELLQAMFHWIDQEKPRI